MLRTFPHARALAFAITSALALASGPFSGSVLADDIDAGARFEREGTGGQITSGYVPLSARSQDTTIQVIVKLEDEPVSLQRRGGARLRGNERQAAKQQLRGKQDSLDRAIAQRGGTVLAKYQLSYNGIKVQIRRDQVASLRSLPGVVAVSEVERMERTNAKSVPFIQAPAAWSGPAGFRGEGVKIAIIDSGIDYTHATFGGEGTPGAYEKAFAASTVPANPAFFGPTAPKVKGGVDLVGDDYTGENAPQPDSNPLDCNGHGTHVSGTAAGFGVLSSGATYSGTYDAATHGNSFKVGPGVAPRAELYAVRVFGCDGFTRVTVDAIEWAVDNGMDVINMSFGSPFGSGDSPSAEAAHNASQDGVIVVASAGNSGPSQYITSAPASGTGVISVAAMDTIAPPLFEMRSFALNTGQTVVLRVNNDVPLAPGTYGIHVLKNPDGSVSLGCNEAEYVNALISGKIVVTHRGDCARVARAVFGDKHGAAAVAMINNATGYPQFEGQIIGNPDPGGEERLVDIPFLGVQGQAAAVFPGTGTDGQKIAAATSAVVTVAPGAPNASSRAPSSFTSGGPRFGDSALKPDIAAPGSGILSAAVGTGSGNLNLSGTSMASSHVAGVAALVRQAHAGWSVDAVKAAIVNTGQPSSFVNGYRTSRVGTGLVRPDLATATSVYATGDPGTASLSFGFREISASFTGTKTLTLHNTGASAASFTATRVSDGFTRTHTTTLPASPVVVPAGRTATVSLTLSITPAQAGGSTPGSAAYREASGNIVLAPVGGANGGISLRVPYLFVPRALSAVSTSIGKWSPGQDATATLTNGGAITGFGDFYSWGLSDRNEGLGSSDVRAVGVQSFASAGPGGPDDRLIVFAVNTYTRWNNAATNEFDLPIRTGGATNKDLILFAADFGLVTTGDFDGRLATFVFNARTGGLVYTGFLATAPTDSSTALLVVWASQLGLSAANHEFRYEAISLDLFTDSADAVAGKASYDAWSGNATQGQFITVAPGASVVTTITANEAAGGITPNQGLMIVTLDNAAGALEAQLFEVPRK